MTNSKTDEPANDRENPRDEMHRYYRVAWDCFDAGNLEQALSNIRRAIELADSPQIRSTYYTTYGSFLYKSGRIAEAIKPLNTAVEIFSQNFVAWNQLGMLHQDANDYQFAAKCFEKAVSIRADFNSFTLLAQCQMHFDKQAAVDSANEALKLNPDWSEALAIRDAALRRMS